MASKRRRTRPAATSTRASTSRPTWVVFLAGLIVGACATVAVQESNLTERVTGWVETGSADGDPAAASASGGATKSNDKNGKPRFEFYTMLPEMEVAVPEEELKPSTRPAPKPKAPAVSEPPAQLPDAQASTTSATPADPRYLIQVGSFSSANDAERLKANLALLGMQVRIQTVQINGANTWHRVRAGPFDSLDQVNEARRNLRSNNFESMVLKVKR